MFYVTRLHLCKLAREQIGQSRNGRTMTMRQIKSRMPDNKFCNKYIHRLQVPTSSLLSITRIHQLLSCPTRLNVDLQVVEYAEIHRHVKASVVSWNLANHIVCGCLMIDDTCALPRSSTSTCPYITLGAFLKHLSNFGHMTFQMSTVDRQSWIQICWVYVIAWTTEP